MLKRQHQLLVCLMAVADSLAVIIAVAAAWALRRTIVEGWFPTWPALWEDYVKGSLALFVVPIAWVMMHWFGLYRAQRDRALWREQVQVVKAALATGVATIVVLWAVGNEELLRARASDPLSLMGVRVDGGRVQIAALAAAMALLVGGQRLCIRATLRAARRRGRNLRHVAIVGVDRLGQIAYHTIERNSWTGLHVAYFVSHHSTTQRTRCQGVPVCGGLDDLEATLEANPVDAVYLALPNARAAAMTRLLERLERFAVDVRIVPDVLPRYLPQSMVVNELDGMPVLSYRECTSSGLGGFAKRVVDIVGSLAAIVAFAPLALAIAASIRLTSPGPIIFKQKRVSLGGRVFKIYKFRTMRHVEHEDEEASWTTRDDPRVTRVGRVLRHTSLDELPQLINVLKGQMSLVGPRPERPELIDRFKEDWRGYMLRQHVKAGITGWAQINGLRGDTSLKKRLQYDLFYIRHWSIWLDLRILALTVVRGFVHRNAH